MTSTRPLVGASRPRRILISVLLPAPLAPTRPDDPGRDVERQRVERDDAGEPLGQRIDADQRRGGPGGGLIHRRPW